MNQEVVIFGVGKYYNANMSIIKAQYKNIVGYCDNDEAIWGTLIDGKRILPTMEAVEKYRNASFVITSPMNKYDMTRQLLSEGVSLERILIDNSVYSKHRIIKIYEDGNMLADIGGKRLIFRNSNDEMVYDEIFNGEYYNVTMPSDFIVIDIGANVGFASAYFSLKKGCKKVYGFEPDQECYVMAKRNYALLDSGNKIEICNIALGRESGIQTYYTHSITGLMKDQNDDPHENMIAVQVKCENAGKVIKEIIERHLNKESIIIKCDCEGGEYEIFPEIEKLGLVKKIDAIIMEWHLSKREEIERFFDRNNFIVHIKTTGPNNRWGFAFGVNCKK